MNPRDATRGGGEWTGLAGPEGRERTGTSLLIENLPARPNLHTLGP